MRIVHFESGISILDCYAHGDSALFKKISSLMRARGFYRGLLLEVFPYVDSHAEAWFYTEHALHECRQNGAVLIVPSAERMLERCPAFLEFLARGQTEFVLVDKPNLTLSALKAAQTKKPDRSTSEPEAKRLAKSLRIRETMTRGKAEGRIYGNPRLDEARVKASAAQAARRPSPEILHALLQMREEGNSYAYIADWLNSASSITPPRGKKWHAASV